MSENEDSAFTGPRLKNVSPPRFPPPGKKEIPRKGEPTPPRLRLGAGVTAGGGATLGRGYGSRTSAGPLGLGRVRRPVALSGLGGPSKPARPHSAPRPQPHFRGRGRSRTHASESLGAFCSVSGVSVSPWCVVRAARPVVRLCARPCPPAGPGRPGTASTAAPPDARTGPQPAPRADGVMRHLPYFCRGQVVRGFGRGSKQLGIPTGERGRARSPPPTLGRVT